MSGISIKTAGSIGGAWIDLGLSAADVSYVFANEQAYSILHNSAYRDAPRAVQAGTPTQNAGAIACVSGANYLQSPVNEPTDGTYFVVAKSSATGVDDANRPYLIGTYGANSKIGAGIWRSGVDQVSCAAQHSGTAVVAGFSEVDWSVPNLFCGRFDATRTDMRNYTTGQQAQQATAVARNLNAARVRVGSGYTQFGGSSDIYFAVVINRYLTDAEADSTAALIRRALTGVVSV